VEPAGIPAPAPLRDLLDELFRRVEATTGWKLTAARSATIEIVRDGQGYRLFAKGAYAGSDLERPPI
jgi:hypothetical protein